MNIGIFTYDFPHKKTQEGLYNLMLKGFKPKVIIAAPPINLNVSKSKIRVSPKDLYLSHPKEIAKHFQIDYCVSPHNSPQTSELIREYDLDLGIILGARIIPQDIINKFKLGILNLHPGLLPENRGLDSLKWAINCGIPQGVSTHLIDGKIDRGLLVEKEEIAIYKDDTLLDINLRLQNLEQKLLISSLCKLEEYNEWGSLSFINLKKIEKGTLHSTLPIEQEKKLYENFKKYKKKYGE